MVRIFNYLLKFNLTKKIHFTDDIKTELQFVGKYWRLSGRPTVCLLIREEHMRDPQFKEMIDLLAMLKKGKII